MVKTYGVNGFALVQPIRLLVVEPDPSERARLKEGLVPRFDVAEATSAAEAVSAIDERYLDAILASYVLDGEHSGVWLLEYVFQHRPNVHRALMSSRWVAGLDELQERGVVWLWKAKPVCPIEFGKYFRESDRETRS